MRCPACDFDLTALRAGKITVDVCQHGCGGVWFDNFELAKLGHPDEFAGEALAHIERDDHRLVDHDRRRTCPRCERVPMMRHYFSDRREVEVDTCPNCAGVWLDAGELAQIRTEVRERREQEAAAKQYLGRFLSQDFVRNRPRA